MKDKKLYFVDYGLEHISFLACKIENSCINRILFFQEKKIRIPMQRPRSSFSQTENFNILIDIINEAEKKLKVNISEIILLSKDQSINLCYMQRRAEFKKAQKVSLSDMEKLSMQCIKNFHIKTGNKYNILDVVFNPFTIDDKDSIKNPYKIPCKSLTMSISIIGITSMFTKYFDAYLERYKIHVKHYISPCISTCCLLLDGLDPNKDFLFIDIGSCMTEFCVVRSGRIVYLDKVALGGLDMTRDIANEMQIYLMDADAMKKKISQNNSTVDDRVTRFMALKIEKILNARLQEIVAHIHKTIAENKKLQNLSLRKIFLFGGVAKYKNIKQLFMQKFESNVEFLDESYIGNSELINKNVKYDFDYEKEIQLLGAVNFYIKNINLYRKARRGFLFRLPSKISCFLKDLLY